MAGNQSSYGSSNVNVRKKSKTPGAPPAAGKRASTRPGRGDRPAGDMPAAASGSGYAERPRSGSFAASRARDRDRSREPASDLECIDCGNTFRNSGEYDKHVGAHNRA